MYGKYLPNKKILSRIILESLLGVFVGGILFSVFLLVYIAVTVFVDTGNLDLSIHKMLNETGIIIFGIVLWTLRFASLPTVLGAIILTALIHRDFRFGNISKSRAIKTGILLAGLVGLSVSIFVVFTTFRHSDQLALLPHIILVTLIASGIGAWGASQIYKELKVEFPFAVDNGRREI